MMLHPASRYIVAVCSLLIADATSVAHAGEGDALFREKIYPLLAAKCLACHGNDAKEIKGQFDLRSRASALKGGESGEAAIVAGEPDKSPLYAAVARREKDRFMPPKENDKLSADEVELVRRWIAAGAPWPEGKTT